MYRKVTNEKESYLIGVEGIEEGCEESGALKRNVHL